MTNLESDIEISDDEIDVGDLSDDSGARDLKDIVQLPRERLWNHPPLFKCPRLHIGLLCIILITVFLLCVPTILVKHLQFFIFLNLLGDIFGNNFLVHAISNYICNFHEIFH